MNRTDLDSPSKRPSEIPFVEFRYDIIGWRYLPVPADHPGPGLYQVLESRQSRREFAAVDESRLSALLWYSCKTRLTQREASGFRWEHRPTPSAGGRHPIDLLILSGTEQKAVHLYDPVAHALKEIRVSDERALHALLAAVQSMLPFGDAVLMWYAAQLARTLSKYEHGESLVWRDAGALLATMNLVAESLSLSFCAVGITGEPWISRMLRSDDAVAGTGGCVLGAAVARPPSLSR